MKIAIFHLSDMHLTSDKNPLLARRDRVLQAVQNIVLESDKVFVVITGDIAYSGKDEEYAVAVDLLEHLKSSLEGYSGKEIKHVVVPGNHDCDFAKETDKVREAIVEQVRRKRDAAVDQAIIEQCCKAQSGFLAFAARWKDTTNTLYEDSLFRIIKYQFGEFEIVFNCFNTSWMSELNEQPGTLHFPITLFPAAHRHPSANLSVSVLHHPYIWHTPECARSLCDNLESISQLVLTGHDHVSSKSMRDNMEGRLTEYIEGAVLQDPHNESTSGFNVIEVDLAQRTQRVRQFEWDRELYRVASDTGAIPCRGVVQAGDVFQVADSFNAFLKDAGAQFTHPMKSELTLEDIYVFPHLRDVGTAEQRGKPSPYIVRKADLLLRTRETDNRVLLIGAEKSGKTALCKMLFTRLRQKRYVPVYVKGQDIRSSSIDQFNRLV